MKKGVILFFVVAIAAIVALAVWGIRKDVKTNGETAGVGIVAHRGYWNCEAGGFARNSLAAFKAAADAGFWGTEFDVNMTADGQLLVFHDSNMEGKRIEATEYAKLADYKLENGETVPTLDVFLEYAAGQEKFPMLVYELKSHSTDELQDRAVAATVAKLKEYGMFDPEKVMFISFQLRQCELLAASAPGFTVQYLGKNKTVTELVESGLNGIDVQFKYLLKTPEYLQQARENGFSVNTWTVNKAEDMGEVLALGIDQLTTDYPELAREVLKEKNIPETVR